MLRTLRCKAPANGFSRACVGPFERVRLGGGLLIRNIIAFACADGRPRKNVRATRATATATTVHAYSHCYRANRGDFNARRHAPVRAYIYSIAVKVARPAFRSCHGNRIENVNPLNQYYTDKAQYNVLLDILYTKHITCDVSSSLFFVFFSPFSSIVPPHHPCLSNKPRHVARKD